MQKIFKYSKAFDEMNTLWMEGQLIFCDSNLSMN